MFKIIFFFILIIVVCRLQQFPCVSSSNPEEQFEYLEGDIIAIAYRNGIKDLKARWLGGVVPYEIAGKFQQQQLQLVLNGFKEFHQKTCIRFRPRNRFDKDYISITNQANGCWSSVGRMGGRQLLNLQESKCFGNNGTILHELMHALGFYHEQNQYERDQYVEVIRKNIQPALLGNFAKLSLSEATSFGVAYDYASVMHYSPYSFSRNGQATLRALKLTAAAKQMGQRKGFSTSDLQKIKAMYKCYFPRI